jgi:hypothetical protein
MTPATSIPTFSLKSWHHLVMICTVAQALRALAVASYCEVPSSDGAKYHHLAEQLVSGCGYGLEHGRPSAFRACAYSLFLAVIVPAIFGAWVVCRRPAPRQWLLWVPLVSAFFLAILFYGSPRFRLPVEPAQSIFASTGLVFLWILATETPTTSDYCRSRASARFQA